ncbi:POU class 2 homeobox associating-factor 2-like [Centropristis striata]|uniref:POU class 2 homeobox associating-factor 2-like n=1 Tax=Centropristis striata TaxID=184440 RepID=UPI0027E19E80|nr:POU class 2 homeobox associating-factor 2-like [Centropristis striata]
MKICMKLCYKSNCQTGFVLNVDSLLCLEYSKRVYQGVRVKHTVKDLLAEKRLRQTSPRYSGGSTSPHSFVQMPGSHMLPSYYGMRRPFISESDFCPSTKQFNPDVYSPTLGGKPLGCEPSAMSSYSSFIDSYYPETFGEYRSAAAFSSSGGSFLPSSALSSLLPFGGESSHLFLRDTWEQSVPEPVSQVEALCPDSLASVSVPPSMPSPDPPGSPSQYRSPSRGSSMGPVSSSQPYTLHSLEEAHYHPLTSSSSYPGPSTSFSCPSYMSTPITDLVSKMVTEEAADSHAGLPPGSEAHSSWAKEDGVSSWSPYEIRRAY